MDEMCRNSDLVELGIDEFAYLNEEKPKQTKKKVVEEIPETDETTTEEETETK